MSRRRNRRRRRERRARRPELWLSVVTRQARSRWFWRLRGGSTLELVVQADLVTGPEARDGRVVTISLEGAQVCHGKPGG